MVRYGRLPGVRLGQLGGVCGAGGSMADPDAVTAATAADMGQAVEIGFEGPLAEFCKEFRFGGRILLSDRLDDLLFTHERILLYRFDRPRRHAAYSSTGRICGLECVTGGDVTTGRKVGLEDVRWLVIAGLQ